MVFPIGISLTDRLVKDSLLTFNIEVLFERLWLWFSRVTQKSIQKLLSVKKLNRILCLFLILHKSSCISIQNHPSKVTLPILYLFLNFSNLGYIFIVRFLLHFHVAFVFVLLVIFVFTRLFTVVICLIFGKETFLKNRAHLVFNLSFMQRMSFFFCVVNPVSRLCESATAINTGRAIS